jgi:hypothetical protein
MAFHQCVAFPRCVPPPISDAFDAGSSPCAAWAIQFGRALVEIRNSELTITPAADGQNSGGCESTRAVPFQDGGFFLEITQILPPHHGFVEMSAKGNTTEEPAIYAQDGMLSLRTILDTVASRPYDPTAMRWWRLRPDRAANTTVAEYGADGYHWTRLGALALPPEAEIRIEFSAGVDDIDPQPATARVAHLDICPPRP